MTPEQRNDSAMGEDVKRDPRLDHAYRAAAVEDPPAHLDAAILAAAHREVGARPRSASSRLRAWHVPAAIAATVVLSVSVVMLVREEGGDKLDGSTGPYRKDSKVAPVPQAAPDVSKAPEEAQRPVTTAEEPRQPAAQEDANAAAKVATESRRRDTAVSATRRGAESASSLSAGQEAAQLPAPVATPSSRPFPPAASAGEQQLPAPYADQTAGVPAGPSDGSRGGGEAGSAGAVGADRPAGAASSVARTAPRAEARALRADQAPRTDSGRVSLLIKELEAQPAQRWLEKIDALHLEGRKDEADELLTEFKRRFPDYPLPPALRTR